MRGSFLALLNHVQKVLDLDRCIFLSSVLNESVADICESIWSLDH